MYNQLVILLALAGCMLVASQTAPIESSNNSTSNGTSNSTDPTEPPGTTLPPGSPPPIESLNNSTSNSTSNSTEPSGTPSPSGSTPAIESLNNSTSNSTSNSTGPPEPPGTRPRPGFPGKPHHHHHHRGPPLPPRNEIPGLSIISDFINAINGFAQSIAPRPVNRGRPGGRRMARSPDNRNGLNVSFSLNGQGLPGLPGVPNISDYQIPNADDIVPEIPELSDPSNLEIPEILNLPRLPMIPGLQALVAEARERVADEISPGQDLVSGIQDAIENGLNSFNPTEAMRRLVSTILKAYFAIARKCPLLIVGGYVMREGLWLTSDILRTIADVSAQIQDYE